MLSHRTVCHGSWIPSEAPTFNSSIVLSVLFFQPLLTNITSGNLQVGQAGKARAKAKTQGDLTIVFVYTFWAPFRQQYKVESTDMAGMKSKTKT